jgi:hypothetical protein
MMPLHPISLALTLGKSTQYALFLLILVLFPFALWAATLHTTRFLIGSVIVLTLIPIFGLPEHSLIHPGVLGLMVIAFTGLIGLLPRRRLRLTLVDVGALIVLAGCSLSVVYGHQTTTNLEIVFFLWFCPYFAGRSIAGSGKGAAVLKAFALAGVVAIPFGIIEVIHGNLFIKIFSYGSSVEYGLGVPTRRLGINRAEGALGQPIPYAMFLSIAAVAAITLWMTRDNRPDNRWLYAGLGLVALQATALARTGWLMLAIVGGLIAALNSRVLFSRGNRRLVFLAIVGIGVVLAVPKTNALILGSSGTESAKLEESAHYRSRLLDKALEPGYINPYGTTEAEIGPLGVKSIDDEYVHAAWTWGYLPLLGFLILFIAFAVGAWRQRRDTLNLSVYATCIATMVALESVAFLTQQEILVWLLWGCASGLVVRPKGESQRAPRTIPLQRRAVRPLLPAPRGRVGATASPRLDGDNGGPSATLNF